MSLQPKLVVVQPGDRPAPMVPVDVDLKELPGVMLDIRWLCDSRFFITASPEEFGAAVRLHARSQQEVPAATLPEDDVELAYLAGFGRDLHKWRAVKEKALEGWVLCADGRHHNRAMAAQILDIWIKRIEGRIKSAKGVAKRRKLEFNPEPFARPLQTAVEALSSIDPQAPILRNYTNVFADIEPAEDEEESPPLATSGQTTGSTLGSTKRREAKLSESEKYISPAAKAAGAESAEWDSDLGCGQLGQAPPSIPILPYPLDAFEQFWVLWPHKVDKDEARKAFTELIDDPPVQFPALLTAVRLYAERKPASHDFAYPATWLRRKRWLDVWPDPPPPKFNRFGMGVRRPFQPQRLNAR